MRRRRRHDVVFYSPQIGAVLFASKISTGGAERQVWMLARLLADNGLRVALILVSDRDDLPESVDGVAIIRIRSPSPRRRFGRVAMMLSAWGALWRACSSVIVERGAGVDLLWLAIYATVSRRRLVFSSASTFDFMENNPRIPRQADQRMYRFGLRRADKLVVQTEEQIEPCRLMARREPHVIRSIGSPRRGPVQQPEAFLWVGRLVSYKRPLDYLALARLMPEAEFWMLGVPTRHLPSDAAVAYETLTEAEKLPNVKMLDSRPHEEVVALMGRAVACVNTSIREGMPNVFLEAWASGVPALALHHDPGGVIARNGLGAFANGSMEMCHRLAADLWHDRYHRDEVSRRCRQYIETHHSPEAVASQWRALITACGAQP